MFTDAVGLPRTCVLATFMLFLMMLGLYIRNGNIFQLILHLHVSNQIHEGLLLHGKDTSSSTHMDLVMIFRYSALTYSVKPIKHDALHHRPTVLSCHAGR